MLIAILADTHMPRASGLPAKCTRLVQSAELVLHAGDMSTCAALEELRDLGTPVQAVRGNVDEAALARELPETLVLEIAGVRIAMTHDAGPAAGRLRRLRKRFPAAQAIIFGHSHIPLLEAEGEFQIFNPGSPTDPRRQPVPTMGMADIRPGAARFEHVPLDAD
ncbi:MAG TPA: metallophosphoesterase family protein [Solirubrobacteraceae bacterium]|jgi:putative phosphoesterase|nr:metallophosphoesterase family protein [Solirubrobacteraceae bacterium]